MVVFVYGGQAPESWAPALGVFICDLQANGLRRCSETMACLRSSTWWSSSTEGSLRESGACGRSACRQAGPALCARPGPALAGPPCRPTSSWRLRMPTRLIWQAPVCLLICHPYFILSEPCGGTQSCSGRLWLGSANCANDRGVPVESISACARCRLGHVRWQTPEQRCHTVPAIVTHFQQD